MAFLDQTCRRGYWLHGRTGIYVYTVQGLHSSMPQMEGVQQNHRCAGNFFISVFSTFIDLSSLIGNFDFGKFPATLILREINFS